MYRSLVSSTVALSGHLQKSFPGRAWIPLDAGHIKEHLLSAAGGPDRFPEPGLSMGCKQFLRIKTKRSVHIKEKTTTSRRMGRKL